MPLKLIAFDLDGTIWAPDMYELWGGGGAPFTGPFTIKNKTVLKDRQGNLVELLGVSARVLEEMKHHWIISAYVSTCDEPEWAKECLKKFKTEEGSLLGSCAEKRLQLIYKANKRDHFKLLREMTGVEYEDMLFFDNQMNNINDVSKLGVKCLYCPEGLTEKSWRKGLGLFNLEDLP